MKVEGTTYSKIPSIFDHMIRNSSTIESNYQWNHNLSTHFLNHILSDEDRVNGKSQVIIDKYRKVKAWYIGIYRSIELVEIWEVHPSLLESLFTHWERKIDREGREINNPKIPLKLVRTGKLVYPDKPTLDDFFKSKRKPRSRKTKDGQPNLLGLE